MPVSDKIINNSILYMKFLESTAKDTFFTNQIDSRYERIQ